MPLEVYHRLKEVTLTLLEAVDRADPDQIELLVDERQNLIDQIGKLRPDQSDQAQIRIVLMEISQLNDLIVEKVAALIAATKEEMKRQQSWIHALQGYQAGSFGDASTSRFIDRKR